MPSPPEPPAAPPRAADGRDRPSPFGLGPLVILAVLVAAGWFISQTLFDDAKVQDCVWSGRRNCARIEGGGR